MTTPRGAEVVRRATGVVLGALLLVFSPRCALQGDTAAPPPSPVIACDGGECGGDGVRIAGATWTMEWNRDRTTALPGGGFSVTTDLGYDVELAWGWFVNYSVSFGPCELPDAGTAASLPSPWLGVRSAFANHSAEEDPSAIDAVYAEDLAAPRDGIPYLESSFPPARYCRVHWLVARADDRLVAPEGAELAGKSLRAGGTWKRGAASGSFEIDTWWPQGHLDELEDDIDPAELAQASQDGKARFALVTVRRSLGSLFDRIDFDGASDDEVAGLTIDNLVSQARITVELATGGAASGP